MVLTDLPLVYVHTQQSSNFFAKIKWATDMSLKAKRRLTLSTVECALALRRMWEVLVVNIRICIPHAETHVGANLGSQPVLLSRPA